MTKRYGEISKKILLGIAIAGVVAIAATSPYFLTSIAKALIKNNKKSFRRYGREKNKENEKKVAQTIARLNKNKLVVLSKENGLLKIKLSEKGLRKIKEIEFDNMEIVKQKKWDKKWRVIIFDIPNTAQKNARDYLRSKLKELKFFPLQKSVFVHPYPCEKEVEILCELYQLWPYVNILLVEKISNDKDLKKHFNPC